MWINVDGLACRIDELVENGFTVRFKVSGIEVLGNDGKLVQLDSRGALGFIAVHTPQTYKLISGERNKLERN